MKRTENRTCHLEPILLPMKQSQSHPREGGTKCLQPQENGLNFSLSDPNLIRPTNGLEMGNNHSCNYLQLQRCPILEAYFLELRRSQLIVPPSFRLTAKPVFTIQKVRHKACQSIPLLLLGRMNSLDPSSGSPRSVDGNLPTQVNQSRLIDVT